MVLFWGVVKHLKEVVLTARQEPNGEDVEANYEELSKEEKEEAWWVSSQKNMGTSLPPKIKII